MSDAPVPPDQPQPGDLPGDQLHVEVVRAAPAARLRLRGDLDMRSVPTVLAAVDGLDPAPAELVVEIDGLAFIDSSGLGMLVTLHKRAQAAGRTVVVECSTRRILRLLELTALDRVLTVRLPEG